MKMILSTLSALALLVACAKDGGGNSSSLSVTVGSDHISAVSATLRGKANLPDSVPSDLVIGFQYSKSTGSDHAKTVIIYTGTFESDDNYRYQGLPIRPVTE